MKNARHCSEQIISNIEQKFVLNTPIFDRITDVRVYKGDSILQYLELT